MWKKDSIIDEMRLDETSRDSAKLHSKYLISYKNMNAQMGEIFRSCYRYGSASHSDQLRDAKKIKFYIDAEIERLETWSK